MEKREMKKKKINSNSKKKRIKKKNWKDKILIIEGILIVLLILFYGGVVLYRKSQKANDIHYQCDFTNPWIDVYREDTEIPVKVGQVKSSEVYYFDVIDETIKNNYVIATYFYSNKEAYEAEANFCKENQTGKVECQENPEELTRILKKKEVLFGNQQTENVTKRSLKQYIEELESSVFQCKSGKIDEKY